MRVTVDPSCHGTAWIVCFSCSAFLKYLFDERVCFYLNKALFNARQISGKLFQKVDYLQYRRRRRVPSHMRSDNVIITRPAWIYITHQTLVGSASNSRCEGGAKNPSNRAPSSKSQCGYVDYREQSHISILFAYPRPCANTRKKLGEVQLMCTEVSISILACVCPPVCRQLT